MTHCSHAQLEGVTDNSLASSIREFAECGGDNEECSSRLFRQVGYQVPSSSTRKASSFLSSDTRSLTRRERTMNCFRLCLWISCPSWQIMTSYVTSTFFLVAPYSIFSRLFAESLCHLLILQLVPSHLIRDHLTVSAHIQRDRDQSQSHSNCADGPWTQKFDDGLETRKTAYETMYTLVS